MADVLAYHIRKSTGETNFVKDGSVQSISNPRYLANYTKYHDPETSLPELNAVIFNVIIYTCAYCGKKVFRDYNVTLISCYRSVFFIFYCIYKSICMYIYIRTI